MRLLAAYCAGLVLLLTHSSPALAEACWVVNTYGVAGAYDTPDEAIQADADFRFILASCPYAGPNGILLWEPPIGYTLGPKEVLGANGWSFDLLSVYDPQYFRAAIIPYGAHSVCVDPQYPPSYSYAVAARRGSPQCQVSSFVIKLSRPDGSSESNMIIGSVEPGKTANTMVARVYDQNNQPVPNIPIKLESTVIAKSGGHNHNDDARHIQHMGKLAHVYPSQGTVSPDGKALTGNTGPDGLSFSFTAPAIAGDHDLIATCTDGKNCQQEGPKRVWVGHKELQSLSASGIYRLIGQTATHPDNHYLTLMAASRATLLTVFYQTKYPASAVLHLNDASLERGGIFDIYPESSPNWKIPHDQHCRGTVIDIRANGAEGALDIATNDDPMIGKIQELGRMVGANPVWEVPEDQNKKPVWRLRHFHTKLMGQEGIQCP